MPHDDARYNTPLGGPRGVAWWLAGLAAWVAAMLVIVALDGCGRTPAEAPAPPASPAALADDDAREAARVVVSIPPLVGIVRPLLPTGAVISSLLPPGASEHGFELTPSAVRELARADVVLLVGLGLEPQVERLLENQPREGRVVVRLAEELGIDGHAACEHGHDHGHDHAHHHGHAVDAHLWLDPVLVAEAAPKVAERLKAALPEIEHERLARAGAEMAARAMEIDREHREALAPFVGGKIVTYHDAFPRLAARYGLTVAAALKLGDGAEPTPGAIAEVARLVREEGVRAVFTEPQASGAIAGRLSDATGVTVRTLDPLGTGDWESLMRTNLRALVEGLQDSGAAR